MFVNPSKAILPFLSLFSPRNRLPTFLMPLLFWIFLFILFLNQKSYLGPCKERLIQLPFLTMTDCILQDQSPFESSNHKWKMKYKHKNKKIVAWRHQRITWTVKTWGVRFQKNRKVIKLAGKGICWFFSEAVPRSWTESHGSKYLSTSQN